MKQIRQIDTLKNAEMSYLYPIFRSLLGYDPFVVFYEPNPDFLTLCKNLASELKMEMDPDFVEFMSITNGGKIDFVTFFSFKNEKQDDDIVFINLDPEKRASLVGDAKGLIVAENDGNYYCYDLLSNITGKSEDTGYAWGLYNKEEKRYMFNFPHFYDLLEFHSQVLRYSIT